MGTSSSTTLLTHRTNILMISLLFAARFFFARNLHLIKKHRNEFNFHSGLCTGTQAQTQTYYYYSISEKEFIFHLSRYQIVRVPNKQHCFYSPPSMSSLSNEKKK